MLSMVITRDNAQPFLTDDEVAGLIERRLDNLAKVLRRHLAQVQPPADALRT